MKTTATSTGLLLLVGIAFAMVSGCGGDVERRRVSTAEFESNGSSVTTPELVQADAKLASIEDRTRELEARVNALQDDVAGQMAPSAVASGEDAGRVVMEVDRNSVLRVNGIVMSRTEYTKFVENRGKAFCTPTPSVSVDPAANYDTVAWVLETAYNAGCGTVEIDEVKGQK